MAAKRKTKNKHTKLKKTVVKKGRSVGKTVRKTRAKRKASPRTRSETKPSLKKAASKTRTLGRRIASAKSARLLKKRAPGTSQSLDRTETFTPQGLRSQSAGQSGDLQGLSDVEAADSESVDELLEEGTAFEAAVVVGVQSAGHTDEEEVRTHEVPEDDVPGEYLDKK
jgi:hypothetical protein